MGGLRAGDKGGKALNKVILIGNLASDPEAFTTQSGKVRSSFRLAVQRRYANAQGVREADFLAIVAWNQTAEFCNRYLTKGRKVAVEGSIQVRSYEAQDGSKRWAVEIIAENVEALGAKGEGTQGTKGTGNREQGTQGTGNREQGTGDRDT